MFDSLPEKIKVRMNKVNSDKPKNYEMQSHIVAVDKNRINSIESLIAFILEKIDSAFDPTETKLEKAKIYSQEGIELKDSDLFFLENFGTLYIDVQGRPFNYKQILHQYRIGEKLGKGRFGVVYKIIDKATAKAFAMKIIKVEGYFSRANNAEILFKEQKALLQLNHTNVVKLYNGFSIKNKICQIMELCAGGELQQYLLSKPQQRVSEKEARYLILQIWRGISYWHQKGIIHRNLKPENIFIADQVILKNSFKLRHSLIIGEVDVEKESYEDIVLKIGDFVVSGITIYDESHLKNPWSINFRAPELLNDAEIFYSRALDIWSIGIILYTMLYGYHPFVDADNKVTEDSIINGRLTFSK